MQGKDLGALVGQIGADIREWEKAALAIEKDLEQIEKAGKMATDNLSKSLDIAGKKMQKVGKSLTMKVSAPLAALGGLAVREFGNFDAAMNKSTAIMGDVTDMLRNEMEQAARHVGRTMSLSATEAADSYFFLASAGLNAEQSIAALPQVAKFAQAGMFDMATATDLATDAQSALGLTVKDTQENLRNLTRVTDVLVKANTLANATVEQFSSALTREAGAALKTFNKDVEEGVAVLAAMADQGVKGEVAGRGLSRIIRMMTQAANNNKEAMQQLGLSVYDSEGRMRNLADIVQNLEDAFRGMSDQQRSAALESIGFTAEVQGIILPLLGTSNAIRKYEAELRKAGGTTAEISDNQMAAFNEQLSLLWDNIKDIGIEFGKTLEPALRGMIKWTQEAVKSFQGLHENTKILVVAVTAFSIALGPIIWALGSLARAMSSILVLLPKVIVAFKALQLALATNPWTLAIGVIGGLAALLAGKYLLATNEATKATNDFEKAMSGSTKSVQEAAKALEGLSLSQMFDSTNKAIAITKKRIQDLESSLKSNFEQVKQAGADAGRSFTEWVDYVAERFNRTDAKDFLGLQQQLQSLKEQQVLIQDLNKLENQRTNVLNSVGGDLERLSQYAQDRLRDTEKQIDLIRTELGLAQQYNTVLENRQGIGSPAKPSVGINLPTDGVIDNFEELTKLINSFETGTTESMEIVGQSFDRLSQRAWAMSSALSSGINQATGDFLEGVGMIMAGTSKWSGVFDSLLVTLADLAVRVGKIAIGVAIAIEGIKKALQSLNPAAAFAAGVALIVLGSWAKSALAKAADGGGSGGSGGRTRSVNDALIRPDGSVIEFHKQDTILAMKDFSSLGGGSAGGGVIHNVMYLDGKVVWENQQQIQEDLDR